MEEEDFAARRAELRAKLRAKCKTARSGGGGQSKSQLEAAAQNALLNIDDPTLFEEAQRAMKTKNTSSLLQTAMRSLQNATSQNANVNKVVTDDLSEDDEDVPPEPFAKKEEEDEEEEEAPPPPPPTPR